MSAPPVAEVVDAVSKAWADGDAVAFTEHYTEDATAILPGFHLRDRAEIQARMAEAFAGPLAGSRRVHRIRSERRYGDELRVIVTRSATVFPGEDEPPVDRWSLATWLLRLDGDQWLVAAYHDCPEVTR